MTAVVQVETKSAWASKINWTQALGVLASVLVLIGIDLPTDVQLSIVAAIQGLQALATWVLKTWFSPTVTTASMGK